MTARQVDRVSRRAFLVGGLGAAAALSTGTYAWLRRQGYEIDPALTAPGPSRPPVVGLSGPAFDPRARAVLTVLIDQLLPGDPTIGLPSGTTSGTLEFLDGACRHRGLRSVRADVVKLCRDLDLRARTKFERAYVDVSEAERDRLLADVRTDTRVTGRYSPQRALHTTLRIALEGYLGNPQHGGNKDASVWDALRIPMPRDAKGHIH